MCALSRLNERDTPSARVILAEDNESLRKVVATRIRALGYDVCEAVSTHGLVQAIAGACFGEDHQDLATVVVSDLGPSRCVLDALRMLRGHPRCPRLVFVAPADHIEFRKEAVLLGAIAVLDKPLDPEALISIVVEHLPTSRC
jgi:CheY-like chemotaxis protein